MTRQKKSTSRKVIKLDLSPWIPVYRQIADEIRAMLVAHEFSPGERLPTVRRVALDLGLNHNTVADAYRSLAEEGWLSLERGHGALVVSRNTPAANLKVRNAFAQRLRNLIAQVRAAGVSPQAIRSEFEEVATALLGPEAKDSGT
ncbi:MAG: GntR family transcriptional regulator [Candidatus Binataceae bacterium]